MRFHRTLASDATRYTLNGITLSITHGQSHPPPPGGGAPNDYRSIRGLEATPLGALDLTMWSQSTITYRVQKANNAYNEILTDLFHFRRWYAKDNTSPLCEIKFGRGFD
jgi:hypothetical protein